MTPRLLALLLARGEAELIDKLTFRLYLTWQRPKDVKRRKVHS
jgi:hypothetical protein